MPPKLDLKNRRKYVYYCYRWPPWATSMVYPTSFWWHLNVSNTILHQKSYFLYPQREVKTPIFVTSLVPIAQLFAPFPFCPLHAPHAGDQKSLQICILLVLVASLDDLKHVSDIILMTSSCMRHYVGCMFLFPAILFHDFSVFFSLPVIVSMIKRTATEF